MQQSQRDYIKEKQSINLISDSRARKIAYSLTVMRRFITVHYADMTTEDVINDFGAVKVGRAIRFKKVDSKMITYNGGAAFA